jgi:hypothetical protein
VKDHLLCSHLDIFFAVGIFAAVYASIAIAHFFDMSSPLLTTGVKTRSASKLDDMRRVQERIADLEDQNSRLRRYIEDRSAALEDTKLRQTLNCVRPTKYDGSVLFNDYLAQFNAVSRFHGWKDDTKGMVLLAQLEGKALFVAGSCVGFQAMVQALSAVFARDSGHAAALKLQTRAQHKEETLDDLALDIEVLTKRAYPMADPATVAKLATDAFVRAIDDSSVRCKVRDSGPSSLQSALSSAKTYTVNKEIELKRVESRKVNVVCNMDPRIDHLEKQIEELSTQMAMLLKRRQDIQCFLCKKYGHIRRNCPHRRGSLLGNEPGLSLKDPATRPDNQGSSHQ